MLNKVLAVAGVVVLLLVVIVVGAVATGYIVIGEPSTAASQILTGDLREPEVGAEEMTIGPLGAPEGSISNVGTDGATFRNEFYVRNPNHIGGTVDLVEYDVYLSGDRDGPYEYLGSGTVEGLEVPPNGTVTETNEFDVGYDDFLTATGTSAPGAVVGGTLYAKVEGEATIDLGVTSFTVEFETVEEID
ncbi:MAG: LEA type 2 family protein [Halobacteriales archaeon]|nr:LEA type 2 family protein [Halobacteriales archaeon]